MITITLADGTTFELDSIARLDFYGTSVGIEGWKEGLNQIEDELSTVGRTALRTIVFEPAYETPTPSAEAWQKAYDDVAKKVQRYIDDIVAQGGARKVSSLESIKSYVDGRRPK